MPTLEEMRRIFNTTKEECESTYATYGKLLDVAEAAKKLGHVLGDDFLDQQLELQNAVEKLESSCTTT